jgi:hypothetical protein
VTSTSFKNCRCWPRKRPPIRLLNAHQHPSRFGLDFSGSGDQARANSTPCPLPLVVFSAVDRIVRAAHDPDLGFLHDGARTPRAAQNPAREANESLTLIAEHVR